MKTIQKFILALTLTALSFGCEDALEEKAYDRRFAGDITLEQGQLMVNSILAKMKVWPYMNTEYFTMLALSTDVFSTKNPGGAWGEWGHKNYGAGSQKNDTFWTGAYDCINQCNAAEEGIMGIADATEEEKAVLLGQVRFYRAMVYFATVRTWGQVPLKLTVTTSPDDAYEPKAEIEAIYDQVISDFQYGVEHLPDEVGEDRQKPSKWTAKSFLSKVYLTMAGKPLEKGNEYYQKALTEAAEVIASEKYMLIDDFANLFVGRQEHNAESIFEFEFIRQQGYGSGLTNFWLPYKSEEAFSPWGTTRFRKKFIADWRNATSEVGIPYGDPDWLDPRTGENDYRYDVSVLTVWKRKGEDKFRYAWPDSSYSASSEPYPYCNKHKDPQGGAGDSAHGNNFAYFRYADLLLIFAEAQNMVTGDPLAVNATTGMSALQALNMLRERARKADGVPRSYPKDITTDDFGSTEEFDELVFAERGWELIGEFHRYHDLQRKGKLKEMLEADVEKEYITYTSSGEENIWRDPQIQYYPRLELFPIPINEINNNKYVNENNPGY